MLTTPRFDCSAVLRDFQHDPARSAFDNLLAMNECYSIAFRRMVREIRRLEAASINGTDIEHSELQTLVDESIAYLDLD
jgi:hypothetical protein